MISTKCMITKHSECHGDEYNGNSLLLELKDDVIPEQAVYTYVYVGSRVYMFTSNSEIKSRIGNSYVPYPYVL